MNGTTGRLSPAVCLETARRVALFALMFIILLGAAAGADAASYYVAHNGSDRNSGTSPSSPWLTVSRADSEAYAPGDTINFEGGYRFSGTITNGSSGSSPKLPVTWQSYGNGKATVYGGTGYAVKIAGMTRYITFRNLNLAGSGFPGNTDDGVNFGGLSHGIVLESLDVYGFGGNGIVLACTHNSRINDVASHDNAGYAGICIYGSAGAGYANSDIYIGHCTAYHNFGRSTGAYSNYLGNGIQLTSVNGATVEHCCSHDNGLNVNGCGGPSGIWCYWCNNVTIQYNEAYHNHSRYPKTACDNDGFDLDGGVTNSTVQYNYSHDNDGCGFMCYGSKYAPSGNTIRYNISQNDGRNWIGPNDGYGAGVWVGGWPAPANIHVYNNTLFASSGQRPLVDLDSGSGCDFRNNIVVSQNGVQLMKGENATCQGNDYWTYGAALNLDGYASLSAWRQGTKQEMLNGTSVGDNVNPLLTNPGGGVDIDEENGLSALSAYRLQRLSPMIGAGVDLATLGISPGMADFYGDAITNVWDVGADVPKQNLLLNAGFETGSLSPGWETWSDGMSGGWSAFVSSYGSAYSGRYHLTEQQAGARSTVGCSQTITNIPNGSYTLTAWLWGGGWLSSTDGISSWGAVCADNFDSEGTVLTAQDNPAGDGGFVLYTIPNIGITNNQCRISLCSSLLNQWMAADDFSFVQDQAE